MPNSLKNYIHSAHQATKRKCLTYACQKNFQLKNVTRHESFVRIYPHKIFQTRRKKRGKLGELRRGVKWENAGSVCNQTTQKIQKVFATALNRTKFFISREEIARSLQIFHC